MSRETNRFVKQLKGSPIRNFDAAISDVKDRSASRWGARFRYARFHQGGGR